MLYRLIDIYVYIYVYMNIRVSFVVLMVSEVTDRDFVLFLSLIVGITLAASVPIAKSGYSYGRRTNGPNKGSSRRRWRGIAGF